MDLETACGSVDGFEICVWDVSGHPIINEVSTADCPCTIRLLYGRYASVLDQDVTRKVYGPPSDTTTLGKTSDEVADMLSIHFGPQTHLVEWSNGKFDYEHLHHALRHIGRDYLMPRRRQVFRPYLVWRLVLADFSPIYGLSYLYQILVPQDRPLALLAHRAGPDVQVLYTLTKLYSERAVKPATRQKITSYFFPLSSVSECDEDLVVEKSEDDEKDIDIDIGNKDLESIGFEDGGLECHEFEGKGSENVEIQDEESEDEGLGNEESRNTEFQM